MACIGCVACSSRASRLDVSTPDATAIHDAGAREDVPSDAGLREAGSIDACPAVPAVSCGLMYGPCSGCCVADLCVAEGYQCGKGLGVCHGPSCGATGGLGQPCVSGLAAEGLVDGPDESAVCGYQQWTGCTDTNAACVDGGCTHCGLAGEPCCDQGCGPHMYCDATQHCNAACGALGQACCAGTYRYICDDGGACLSFGENALPTCVSGSPCHADGGSCTTCGGFLQACCGDGGCNAYGGGTCWGDAGCMVVNKK